MDLTIRIFRLAVLIFFSASIYSQDCFYPPTGYTLYTTDEVIYDPPALTGFVTFSEFESANWSINSVFGSVTADLIDDEGRTSTLEITGEGSLVIDAEITDFSVEPNLITNCTQSFSVEAFSSNIVSNPGLDVPCPINLVLVLDESGSIADAGIAHLIRDGVMQLANILNESGSRMAVVEFNSLASRVDINSNNELQEVNTAFLNGLNTYLTEEYDPSEDVLQLIGGTNWEDALKVANTVSGADFILLLTDGNPTLYSFNGTMMGSIAGEGDMFDLTALKEAQDVANQIKQAGKHMFVIGVDIPVNIQPIIEISGPVAYNLGDNGEAFFSSDYISVSSSEITEIFVEIGLLTCGPAIPTLSQWGIIILVLLMLIVGVVSIKNRAQVHTANTDLSMVGK